MKAVHAVAGLFISLALHAVVIGAIWLFSAEKPEQEQPDPGLLSLALAEPPKPEAIEEPESEATEAPEPDALEEPEQEPIEEPEPEVVEEEAELPEPEAIEEELPEPEPAAEEETLAEAVLEEHTPPGDATEEPAEADATDAIEETKAETEAVAEPAPTVEGTELAEAEDNGEIEDILGGADAESEREAVSEATSRAGGEFAAPKVVLSFASPGELFQAATRRNMYLFGVDSLNRGVVRISRDGGSITDHRGPIRVSGAWSSVPLEIEFTGSRDLRAHFGSSWNPRIRRVIAVMPSGLARQIGSVQERQLGSLGMEPEEVETIYVAVSPDGARPVRVVRVIKR